MKRYVVGFLQDRSGYVGLLRKDRPEWQAGMLNGIGGHVEPGETWMGAMEREAREEASLGLAISWECFAAIKGDGWEMYCFRAEVDDVSRILPLNNDVGEEFESYPLWQVEGGALSTIPNLRWLVSMAQNPCRHEWPYRIITEGSIEL